MAGAGLAATVAVLVLLAVVALHHLARQWAAVGSVLRRALIDEAADDELLADVALWDAELEAR